MRTIERDENGYLVPIACGTRRDDEGGGYHWALFDRAAIELEAEEADCDDLGDVSGFRAHYGAPGGSFRHHPSYRVVRTRVLVTQCFGIDI
jgi:hypothetical protein